LKKTKASHLRYKMKEQDGCEGAQQQRRESMDAAAYLDATLRETFCGGPGCPEGLRLGLDRCDPARIWEWGRTIPEEIERRLLIAAGATLRAAQRGIIKPRGEALGYELWRQAPEEDLLWMIRAFVAAGLDFFLHGGEADPFRFEGDPLTGALLSLPLAVYAEGAGKPPRRLAEALAIALLIAGTLRPVRSSEDLSWEECAAAAAGSSAGLVALNEGNPEVGLRAVATLVGSALGAREGTFSAPWTSTLSALAGQAYLSAQVALCDRGISSDFEECRRTLAEWGTARVAVA
jgi:hypothetical protein